jgi:hypothetical protein
MRAIVSEYVHTHMLGNGSSGLNTSSNTNMKLKKNKKQKNSHNHDYTLTQQEINDEQLWQYYNANTGGSSERTEGGEGGRQSTPPGVTQLIEILTEYAMLHLGGRKFLQKRVERTDVEEEEEEEEEGSENEEYEDEEWEEYCRWVGV